MAWTGLALTVEGRNALNRAQMSNKINFKSIVVGDGNPPANFSTIKALVHQLYELDDLKIDVTEDGCTLTADFPEVGYNYYFREVGVMVDTDDGEKLYVYDNCGDDAQYIISTTGTESTKKRIRLSLKISDVEEITVTAPSVLYVSYDDFERVTDTLTEDLHVETVRATEKENALEEQIDTEKDRAVKKETELEESARENREGLAGHIKDTDNPHKTSKEQVGLGNVPNVATNDQTPTFTQASTRSNIESGEKLSGILGKIKKWFADLKTVAFSGSYNDLSNKPTSMKNPSALTIKLNGTSQGVYDGSAAKTVDVTPGGIGAAPCLYVEDGDFNDMTTPGIYIMGNTDTNSPTGGSFHGLIVLNSDTGGYVEQIAFAENSYNIYIRSLDGDGDTWSGWKRLALEDDAAGHWEYTTVPVVVRFGVVIGGISKGDAFDIVPTLDIPSYVSTTDKTQWHFFIQDNGIMAQAIEFTMYSVAVVVTFRIAFHGRDLKSLGIERSRGVAVNTYDGSFAPSMTVGIMARRWVKG